MELKVYLPQYHAIKLGLNRHGYVPLEVDVASLVPVQREELARAEKHDNREGHYFDLALEEWSAEGVIVALDAAIAKRAQETAKKATELEAAVNNLLGQPMDVFTQHGRFYNTTEDVALKDPRLAERIRIRDAWRQQEVERDRAERLAENERIKQARAEETAHREAQDMTENTQVNEWVATQGTPNQRARHAAGLLARDEVLDAIEEEAFKPLQGRSMPYEKMQAKDVCTCEDYSPCHVGFSSCSADSATAEEWEKMEGIKALLPSAEVQLRTHTGESKHCDETVTRNGLRVTVTVGAFEFSREYAAEVPQA